MRIRLRQLVTVTAATIMLASTAIPAYAAVDPGSPVHVRGQVVDGGGHGWPLYARIDGGPDGPVYTSPSTGRYDLTLPAGGEYALTFSAQYPGYAATTDTVEVSAVDVNHDVVLNPELELCTAPGYRPHVEGLAESFDSPPPPGWTTVDNRAGWWRFAGTNESLDNSTGGTGGFASGENDGSGAMPDATLRSPTVDLTGVASPVIRFNTNVYVSTGAHADVDVSVDGGLTWFTAQRFEDYAVGLVVIPIPQAAGRAAVQVRFHFAADLGWRWQVDDVVIGSRTCETLHGGLVVGRTIDAMTGQGLDGTTVTSVDQPADHGISTPMPDPCLCAGFYWLFSTLTGEHNFTASHPSYLNATSAVNVAADAVTWTDYRLGAGQLTVTPASLERTLALGSQGEAKLAVKNTGVLPVNVTVGERSEPGQEYHNWRELAALPVPVKGNAAATGNAIVYSVGGQTSSDADFVPTAAGYAYHPAADFWSPIAPMRVARIGATAAFVGGKLYIFGGYISLALPTDSVEIYDPASNTWSDGANVPLAVGAAGLAVLGTNIYVVGGCDALCNHTEAYRYDTVSGTWTQVADYPRGISHQACGGILGQVYCAGGVGDVPGPEGQDFRYDPAANAWSPIASMPMAGYDMSHAATADALLVSGGIHYGYGFIYRPTTDSWEHIEYADISGSWGAGACGFYRIGGTDSGELTARVSVLSGYDQCGSEAAVPWMSVTPTSLTLQPGASTDITVGLNAARVDQPGDHYGFVELATNTPYGTIEAPVTLTVTPPASWGKITGTVSGAACGGTVPLSGATVQIGTKLALFAGDDGTYTYWLDQGASPLTVIAAKDNWQPQTRPVTVVAGQTTVVDWMLAPAQPCV